MQLTRKEEEKKSAPKEEKKDKETKPRTTVSSAAKKLFKYIKKHYKNSEELLYGSKIIKESDGKFRQGSIYTLVAQLESMGLVKLKKEDISKREKGGGVVGKPKMYIKLTKVGRKTKSDEL